MSINAVGLVFDKIEWFFYLADIVIIPTDFGKQRVRIDFGSRCFDHGADNHGMMICSWSFYHKSPEDRLIKVCKFKKFDISCIAKGYFYQRCDAGGDNSCSHTSRKCKGPVPQKFGNGGTS